MGVFVDSGKIPGHKGKQKWKYFIYKFNLLNRIEAMYFF